ncbi:MAG: PepSY domain-containing protein [Gammaproteobacteria bacterium]|nr:MAG: PepSY domain-containing protein [Gammaproteobacteria bacterium]
MKFAKFAWTVLTALLCTSMAQAQDDEAHKETEAARNTPALAAATGETQGTPISGKFELEEGKLQLSVYTMKDGKFYEVIVDHKTGKIAESKAISGGEDLAAAQHQAEAIAKGKRSLHEAVTAAERANPGYKAIQVEAEMEDGTAQAGISLLKGTQAKHMERKL